MSSTGPSEPSSSNVDGGHSHIAPLILNQNVGTAASRMELLSKDAAAANFETLVPITTVTTAQQQPVKTQVLPVVYIQAPSKIAFTKANSMIVNPVPQFQFASLGATTSNKTTPHNITLSNITVSGNQSVILAPGKPQPFVIQNTGNVAPTYLTMFTKPITKVDQSDCSSSVSNSAPQEGTLSLQTAGKYVLAPMQRIATTNRIPATVTTNSVQPKIAFMPLTIPSNDGTKQLFNIKISDTKLNTGNTVKLITNCNNLEKREVEKDDNDDSLICQESIDLVSSEKDDNSDDDVCEIKDDSPEPEAEPELKNPDPMEEIYLDDDTPSESDSNSSLKIKSDSIVIPEGLYSDLQISTMKKPFENNLMVTKEPAPPPKFSNKHGISILKKNYQLGDKKCDLSQSGLVISKVTNNATSFPDVDVKDSVAISKESNEVTVIETPIVAPKQERRRKANFSYRVGYDDMEIEFEEPEIKKIKPDIERYKQDFESADIVLTKLSDSDSRDENLKKELKQEVDSLEIEVIKEKVDIKIKQQIDIQKMLKWEGDIGSLPGSEIKFMVNEFDLIEYITPEEHKKLMAKRSTKAKETVNDVMQCLECGCYGLPTEFVTARYCSYDCQQAAGVKERKEKLKEKAKKRKRKQFVKSKAETMSNDSVKTEKEESAGSEIENSSNENSQDKFSYPWNCSKKGFSWAKYLEHMKARAAPVKLFKDAFPYNRNGFRQGMKLEGVDPQHPSYFCVLTIAKVIGYRIRLHFDGYPENYDFWANADSMDIFPIGWCEKYGHELKPPPGYNGDTFNWVTYLKNTKSTAAPKQLFSNRAGNAICPNGFRVGMKLEAVDRKNNSLVCVATVRDMMDNRILVHFDSWDDIYDYWADPTSPYIHPVGWCDQCNHRLTPPNDYPDPECFTWEAYLKQTRSVAAPVRAFKQRPACGFRQGMRLECVDRRVPELIRVATVDSVRDHQIRIKFDGWPDRYSYWVEDDWTDIHPVGWCHKTGHPLEPPLTPDDVYDFLECPTVGCRGIGHIKGPKYATHSNQKYCPYAEENIDIERVLPDRLLSPDRVIEAVVPVSREPKDKSNDKTDKQKPRLGRPPKLTREDEPPPPPPPPPPKREEDEIVMKKPKRTYKRPSPKESPERDEEEPIEEIEQMEQEEEEEEDKKPDVTIKEKADALIELEGQIPAEKESWHKHINFLRPYIKNEKKASCPTIWSVKEVCRFLSTLPDCYGSLIDRFREHEVDGEALLSLSQADLVDFFKMKLGPAIKTYNAILLLRKRVTERPHL